MKRFIRMGLAIAALLGLAAPVAAQPTALKVGVVSVEPYGGEAGIFIDIMNAVKDAGGFDFTYVGLPLGEHIAAAAAGTTDILAVPLAATPERQAMGFTYTAPIFKIGEGLLVLVSNNSSYRGLADVDGDIGFVAGAAAYDNAIKAAGRVSRSYPTSVEMFAALASGEIKAALYPQTTFAYMQSTGQLAGLKLADGYVSTVMVAVPVGVRPGGPADLATRVEAALTTLRSDGRLGAILDKWNLDAP